MVITVQITPNGKVTEMSSEEADKQKGERIYSGAALNVPEHWEHKRYRLTMTMLDTFDCEEDPRKGDRPAEGDARHRPRGDPEELWRLPNRKIASVLISRDKTTVLIHN